MPYLKVLNEVASHIDQGGRRKGSIAVYLEPWHSDIMNFVESKMNTGVPEMRARDLFYGLWIPDIFMDRVKEALDIKKIESYYD
jgi:ribonucleotide reductase alpha subunit